MDLLIKRTDYREDGIYSKVLDESGSVIFVTLDHAYIDADGKPYAKVGPGVYTCKRGTHQLHDGIKFDTFEVTGVPNHSGILFHVGNFNRSSDGCFLVGDQIFKGDHEWMVTDSRKTFAEFMALQAGVDTFQLTVIA